MTVIGDGAATEELRQALRQELREASDEQIEAALELADPNMLRAALYQLTGDEEILDLEVVPVGAGMDEGFKPTAEGAALLRRKTAALLREYRDSGAESIAIGPPERLATSLSFALGIELDEDRVTLYTEELGVDPWARSPQWESEPDPKKLEEFNVVVVGASFGGLGAALQLKRAGIPFKVVEKNAGAGGTWWENRYPGIRVDVPSRGYVHLFGANYEFDHVFSPGAAVRRYLDWVADEFDLRDHIQFNTEVRSLHWDEDTSTWEIRVGDAGDPPLRANAVITSCGYLNQPSMPQIDGMEDFKGPSWHPARWPADFDHEGKRIAVIGTGATGYQMVPELALEAEQVVVFQRTPQWLMPTPGYLSPLPEEAKWVERNVPLYGNFLRAQCAAFHEAWRDTTEIDPEFEDPNAVNARNARQREATIQFLRDKLGDPDLVEKMTPPHPFGSARPVAADTAYSFLDAIQRDNVTLVSDGIRRITETGVVDGNGVEHEVDAIVYATGFKANEFLFPMEVEGRGGKTLTEMWADGGARAYRGSMVPGFPNFWMIYGPNTNGGLQPLSHIDMVTYYAMLLIERLILDDKASVEPTEEAYWEYAELMDRRNGMKVWSDPRAHNYYWTEHGRSAVMNPFTTAETWRLLRFPDYDDLELR